jgi:hypothetical protein
LVVSFKLTMRRYQESSDPPWSRFKAPIVTLLAPSPQRLDGDGAEQAQPAGRPHRFNLAGVFQLADAFGRDAQHARGLAACHQVARLALTQ